jgi:phosphohistidine phosphatase SixA
MTTAIKQSNANIIHRFQTGYDHRGKQGMPAQTILTLLAIRHGETVLNVEKRYQGHGDSPLTETGRNQVSSLGRRMGKMVFDTLISSDLGRAQQTASIIADYTGHSVKTDSRLRERNYGIFYDTVRWVIETWCDTGHLEDIGQHFGLG